MPGPLLKEPKASMVPAAISDLRLLVVDCEAASARDVIGSIDATFVQAPDAACTAEDALAMMKDTGYDLVLAECELPGMSGTHLLTRISSHYPGTGVVLMIGRASTTSTVISAFRSGALDVVLKPIEPTEFKNCIQRAASKHLSSQRQNQDAQRMQLIRSIVETNSKSPDEAAGISLDFSGLRLLPDEQTVYFHGNSIDLTSAQCRLLRCLLEARGQPVAFETLAWAMGRPELEKHAASSLARYHVHRLRRRLATSSAGRELVVLVRGVGYKLSLETSGAGEDVPGNK